MTQESGADQIARGIAQARADRQAVKPSHAGSWTVLAGIAVGIVGAIVLGASASKKKAAEAQRFADSVYGLQLDRGASAAITMGHVGLGVLIFGAALLLLGIALKAFGR